MTDEEMVEEYTKKEGFRSGMFGELDNITSSEANKEIKQAFLAGLKAGRPQWHDLRKDPNDLPKEDRYYLIYTVLGNYYVSKHHHNTNYWIGIQNQFVSIKQVIAWCEIPTFDKE